MSKTDQPELLLQADIVGHRGDKKTTASGLRGQGFWAEKTTDRFKAGRPDLRISRNDVGQLDVELKYCELDILHGDDEIDLGFTTLQWLKLKEMNEHGMPAVGLVYFARTNFFLLTIDRVLRRPLPVTPYTCLKLPSPKIIDGAELVRTAKEYLNGLGYRY